MRTLVNLLGDLIIIIALIVIGAVGLTLLLFFKLALIGGAVVLLVLVVIGSLFHKDR